jgi:replication initiation and membrane attachment protein DnaB
MRQISDFSKSTAWKNEFDSIASQLNFGILESKTIEEKDKIKTILEFAESLKQRWEDITTLLEQELSVPKQEAHEEETGIRYRDII